jgi:hypothetical protein
MPKRIIISIVLIIIIFTGCTTLRTLESARSRIAELEELNAEGDFRNTTLQGLLKAERTGNEELERILTEKRSELEIYFRSEKLRIEAERKLADSLSGIFSESTDIITQLIEGYRQVRAYLEAQGLLVEDFSGGSDRSRDIGDS